MLLKNKKVAIIGAGPVGLTMAKLLQQNGISVTVYERDKDAQTRISGGTLDLHKGTGQDAMKEAGLLERYYEMAKPMSRTVVDETGNVLLFKNTTPEEQYDNPEINRNDLRKILLESLKPDTVIWNRKFTGLEEKDGQWNIYFENEANAIADFVIGANGGMSKARSFITDAKIEYTGTLILQGEVNHPENKCNAFYQLCNNAILMMANNGISLVANPQNNGVLSYNVIFKKPEEWTGEIGTILQNKDNTIAFLLQKFPHWDNVYKELFRSTDSFVIWPTRKISMDNPWKNKRPLPITLIGDAAHIMPPFAGQGVNIGLMDALILSQNLTNKKFTTIEAAIKDYEQKMFDYAKKAQQETNTNEIAMLHSSFTFQKFYQ